jgi:hypothetical protein
MGTASAAVRRRTYQPPRLRIPIPLSAIENPDSVLGGSHEKRSAAVGGAHSALGGAMPWRGAPGFWAKNRNLPVGLANEGTEQRHQFGDPVLV